MIEVDTTNGRVRGRLEDGLAVFRGVPFAAPPVGELRFGAPQPPEPWDVLDAATFGPAPPQPDVPAGQHDARGWLTANVWTAEVTGRRPVMVWFYGGGYGSGYSADPSFDGSTLAREGVVVVTFNYRVGAEGFGVIAGAPANRGLLDQLAALQWVHDEVARFGGDPAEVTVFGQSAGAGSIACLLALPRAARLFHRAILQSVPGIVFSPALAADVTSVVAAELGRGGTRAELADVPPQDLADAGAALDLGARRDRWGTLALTPTPFAPVLDDRTLPATPWVALRAGAAAGVDVLVGHNREEYRLFLALSEAPSPTDTLVSEALAAFAPDDGAYRAAYPAATRAQLYETVQSDWFFRMPSLHVARAHRGRSYLYELVLPAPARGGALGACHSLDVPLVFGTLTSFLPGVVMTPDPTQDVVATSRAMRAAWTAFARGESPGWAPWDDGTRATWVVSATPAVARYPEEASAELFADHEPRPLDLPPRTCA